MQKQFLRYNKEGEQGGQRPCLTPTQHIHSMVVTLAVHHHELIMYTSGVFLHSDCDHPSETSIACNAPYNL